LVGRVGATVALLTAAQAAVLVVVLVVAFRSQLSVARDDIVEEGVALALLAIEPADDRESTESRLDRLSSLRGFAIALYDEQGQLLHATRRTSPWSPRSTRRFARARTHSPVGR
jgi:hypothetical protein